MKIISFYLPQFHQTEENSLWWGEGHTEWTLVNEAKPLFDGHTPLSPPLNEYDLTDVEALKWQAKLAKDYGIYGFCIYHYWFEGKKLLHKPLELLLEHTEIDMPFCLCWANESWTDTWRNPNPQILLEQTYGKRAQWKEHFEYLKNYFFDKRYIKIDGKPLLVIYRPSSIPDLEELLTYWRTLALECGIGEISIAFYHCEYYFDKNKNMKLFDYQIEHQPTLSKDLYDTKYFKRRIQVLKELDKAHFFKRIGVKRPLIIRDYDVAWKHILNTPPLSSEKSIPGSFVNWDNTARYGRRGDFYLGFSPDKFEKYFYQQLKHAKEEFSTDYIFLFAWNEWSEGGYLEPDIKDGYKRLQAVKNALDKFKRVYQQPENKKPS